MTVVQPLVGVADCGQLTVSPPAVRENGCSDDEVVLNNWPKSIFCLFVVGNNLDKSQTNSPLEIPQTKLLFPLLVPVLFSEFTYHSRST